MAYDDINLLLKEIGESSDSTIQRIGQYACKIMKAYEDDMFNLGPHERRIFEFQALQTYLLALILKEMRYSNERSK